MLAGPLNADREVVQGAAPHPCALWFEPASGERPHVMNVELLSFDHRIDEAAGPGQAVGLGEHLDAATAIWRSE